MYPRRFFPGIHVVGSEQYVSPPAGGSGSAGENIRSGENVRKKNTGPTGPWEGDVRRRFPVCTGHNSLEGDA